jgi:hypothetical protein
MKRVVLKGTGRGNRAPRGGVATVMDIKDDVDQTMVVSDSSCLPPFVSTNGDQLTTTSSSVASASATSNPSSVTSSEAALLGIAHPSHIINKDSDMLTGQLMDVIVRKKLVAMMQQVLGQSSSPSIVPTRDSYSSILSAYQSLFTSSPRHQLKPSLLQLLSSSQSSTALPVVNSGQDHLISLLVLHQKLQLQRQQQAEQAILQQLLQQPLSMSNIGLNYNTMLPPF